MWIARCEAGWKVHIVRVQCTTMGKITIVTPFPFLYLRLGDGRNGGGGEAGREEKIRAERFLTGDVDQEEEEVMSLHPPSDRRGEGEKRGKNIFPPRLAQLLAFSPLHHHQKRGGKENRIRGHGF